MLRGLVSSFFTRRALTVYADSIRATVNSLFDAAVDSRICDFSSQIAERLPITATCNLLGISEAEAKSLADMVLKIDSHSPSSMREYNDAVLQFFRDLTEERRRAGTHQTIVDIVAHAEVEGQPVRGEDLAHLLWVLFHGGIDSTVHAATGGLLALFHYPDQLAALKADASL